MTSLPQQGTRYPNIEVKRLHHDNSSKLVIGTKVLNVLVTSSARLDWERLLLGASNTNGFDPSRHTAIYVTQAFLDWYEKESFDNTYKQLYSSDELSQLKQVRPKFDCSSTYLRCRSSSKITNDLRSRPATIWTLADFDLNATPSAASLASTLFRHIATEIMKDGAKATLLKSKVSAIHESLKDGKTKAIFSKIMQSFGTKDNQLILRNKDLNTLLTELASTYRHKSNISMTIYITPYTRSYIIIHRHMIDIIHCYTSFYRKKNGSKKKSALDTFSIAR